MLVGGTGSYTFTGLATGYYAFDVSTDDTQPGITLSYETWPYSCPFSSNYNDQFAVFAGCIFPNKTVTTGFPCLRNDEAIKDCLECYHGWRV